MNSNCDVNSREAWTICPTCKEYIDSVGRCGCDYKRSPGGNGHHSVAAIVLALLLALATMLPAKAEDAPPSVGEPPTVAVEHRVFLPFVAAPEDDPTGQGRYWGGVAQYASRCPSCSPR